MENSTTCDNASVLDLRNVSDKEIATQFYYSDAEKFVILVFYPCLLAFGLVGNLAFLAVVAKMPSMRTITNNYLANLAVCDIFIICTESYDIFIAYLVSPDVKMTSYNTSYGCSIVFGLLYIGHFTSFWIVIIMSFERYMAICRPLQHRMVAAIGRTKKLILLAWTVGFLNTVFILPGFSSLRKSCILWPDKVKYNAAPSVLKRCVPLLPFYKSLVFIVQVIPYIITVVLSSCMYYRILKTLNTRLSSTTINNSKDRTAALNKQRAETARNQVARLLIATGVLLILCMAPYYVTRFNDALLYLSDNKFGFRLEQDQYGVLLWVVRGISTINSVINPVIYSVTNRRYRRAFLQVFTCAGDSKADLTRMTTISDKSQVNQSELNNSRL